MWTEGETQSHKTSEHVTRRQGAHLDTPAVCGVTVENKNK